MNSMHLTPEQIEYLENEPKVPNNDAKTDEAQWINNAKINSETAIERADFAVGALLEGFRHNS